MADANSTTSAPALLTTQHGITETVDDQLSPELIEKLNRLSRSGPKRKKKKSLYVVRDVVLPDGRMLRGELLTRPLYSNYQLKKAFSKIIAKFPDACMGEYTFLY